MLRSPLGVHLEGPMNLELRGIAVAEIRFEMERRLVRLSVSIGKFIWLLTHSIPTGFDLYVYSTSEELLSCSPLREEWEENCNHWLPVNISHCKGIVKQMWLEIVQTTSGSVLSIIRLQ